MSTTASKINHIYTLLAKLAQGETLYPQNIRTQEELFGASGEAQERALRRYLKEINALYGHIVVTEKKKMQIDGRKLEAYRLPDAEKDKANILHHFIEYDDDLGWLIKLVHESDPKLLYGESAQMRESFERIMQRDEGLFLFVSMPFEALSEPDHKKHFAKAKSAVKLREYRTIRYHYKEEETLRDVKCLRLVFMRNNWYLAIEDDKEELRFLRLSFVRSISYPSAKYSKSYPKSVLEKHAAFFKRLQNPMSLNRPPKKARLRASAEVALYFGETMKPFFPSQKFLRSNSDGSVDFTVDYTQPMEILPFIKQWQPDLTILEPESLRDKLRQDLQKSVENHRASPKTL